MNASGDRRTYWFDKNQDEEKQIVTLTKRWKYFMWGWGPHWWKMKIFWLSKGKFLKCKSEWRIWNCENHQTFLCLLEHLEEVFCSDDVVRGKPSQSETPGAGEPHVGMWLVSWTGVITPTPRLATSTSSLELQFYVGHRHKHEWGR